MNSNATIEDIRATLATLSTQLDQYLSEGEANMTKIQSHISTSSAGIAVEATMNDIVGEGVALPGSGETIFTRAIAKRRNELDLIKTSKDKVGEITKALKIVGHRFVSGNQNS